MKVSREKKRECDAMTAFCVVDAVEKVMIGEGVTTAVVASAMSVSQKTARKRLNAALELGLVIRQQRQVAGSLVQHIWFGMFSDAFIKYMSLYDHPEPTFASVYWSMFARLGYEPSEVDVYDAMGAMKGVKKHV